jgi:DamX protein
MNVHLLLATEPGRLGFPTDDAKRVHVVVLQPFDAQQSGDYIQTRLASAGLVGNSPFNAAVVDALHQDSGGVPGTLHAMALHTLLANTDIARLSRPKVKFTRPLAYLLGALAVAGAGALILAPAPETTPMTRADAGASGTIRGRIAGVDSESAPPSAGSRAPSPQASADAQPRRVTGGIAAGAPGAQAGATKEKTETVVSGSDARGQSLDARSAAARPAVVVEPPAAVKGAPPAKVTPGVRLAANVTPAVGPVVDGRGAHDLDWLRQQNRSDYVIQLVGTRDAAAVGRFLEEHKLGSKGAWFVTSLDNKPWYVVVYGMYPSSAKARAAIEALPGPLRAGAPWPRSVASVVDSAR